MWFKHILFRYKVYRKGLDAVKLQHYPSPSVDLFLVYQSNIFRQENVKLFTIYITKQIHTNQMSNRMRVAHLI